MRHVHTWILAAPLLIGSMVLAHAAFTPPEPQVTGRSAAAGTQEACTHKSRPGKVPAVTAIEAVDPACDRLAVQ